MDKALLSKYIIDGIQQDFCPAAMLNALLPNELQDSKIETVDETIIDESAEAAIHSFECPNSDPFELLKELKANRLGFPLAFASVYTRNYLAYKLIDTLWLSGHFRLRNLLIYPKWTWNEAPLGAFAAFYESVAAIADYSDALGIGLSDYCFEQSENDCSLEIGISAVPTWEDEKELDFGKDKICPNKLVADEHSWLLYLPFDTAEFRLGGSELARAIGLASAAPVIEDADYFIDCYEVVREFAEDGVLLSAATVGRGGLLKAVEAMSSESVGIEINLSDLQNAAQDKNRVQLLFAELPGVLIQIKNYDFDYVDAELLLQDVAYYPLGMPDSKGGVRIESSSKNGIQNILNSLMINIEGSN